MTIRANIPLPRKGNSSNHHGAWQVRARDTKWYREQGYLSVFGIHNNPEWEPIRPVRIDADFYMGADRGLITIARHASYRPLDIANAISSLKGAIDGLVDAGVVPDDSHKWVTWGEVHLYRTKKQHQGKSGVVLIITQLEKA